MKKMLILRSTLRTLIIVLCVAFSISAAEYTVTNDTDINDGTCDSNCSLREAVNAANATPDDDIIVFDPAYFNTHRTITLGGSEIMILANGSLTINGTGSGLLTISGNNASRIFSTNRDVVAFVDGITFTNGNGVGALNSGRAGAVFNVGGTLTLSNCVFVNNTAANGGAVNNSSAASPSQPSDLTINNCHFAFNSVTSSGGALQNFTNNTVRINNSTFYGNTSGASIGAGALQLNGVAFVTNSTFVANTALHPSGHGGAIQSNGSMFVMTNSTIVGNTSNQSGGGFYRGTTNVNGYIRNSIIAGNSGADAPDAAHTTSTGGTISSMGNNIIGVVGTSTGWVKSDILDTDPMLSPLGDYGGTTMTIVPLDGSPAINGGQNCVLDMTCAENNPPIAVSSDQRGVIRNDGVVDIGAVENSLNFVAELPDGTAGSPYEHTFVTDMTEFTFGATGNIPPGLSILIQEPGNGGSLLSLVGTPLVPGTYDFTLNLFRIDPKQPTSVNYTVTIEGTTATASISGRVLAPGGAGIPNAYLFISSNDQGLIGSVRTNSFGRFRFSGLPVGVLYTITTVHKEYDFDHTSVQVDADITGVEITPVE
jgi:CSLREA domain-containing protein